MNDKNLGIAIIEGAWSAEAKELAADVGELEVDAFFDDGILKEIPVIKSLIAFWKTGITIKDRLFLRKVAIYIAASPSFTPAELEKFVTDHWHDKDQAKRLGSTVLLILERLDDFEKPAMLAKVFAALIRGHITHDAFRRLASGIDHSSIQDLKALAGENVVPEHFAEQYPWGLVRSGFARLQIKTSWDKIGEVEAKVSDLGLLFQKCILNSF